MADDFSSIESEFTSQADADAYDVWFRAKIAASLADPRPSVPHDEAMASVRKIIADYASDLET